MLPDFSNLHINGGPSTNAAGLPLPDDIDNARGDKYMEKLKDYAKFLPYSIEPYSSSIELLDFFILRLTQSIEARDFDIGFEQWCTMLEQWSTLKYPIPKDRRIKLAKLFFHLGLTPGLSQQVMGICVESFSLLTRSKRKVKIEDMRLPWKPIYDILSQQLFLSRRQFDLTFIVYLAGCLANDARRFFHPAAINEMMSTFLPLFDGTNLDTVLPSHFYLTAFLPLSHPQYYLPMMFRLWESINSYMYDERMLPFISELAKMHTDPEVSNPRRIKTIPDDEISEGEGRPKWDNTETQGPWQGLYKDVGIFTEHQWNFLMCKCLSSMEIPLADGGSLTTGPSADKAARFEFSRLPESDWRIPSLARIIVYSMTPDSVPVPYSDAPTPIFSPLPSGVSTPRPGGKIGDYLSNSLGKKHLPAKPSAYLGGSKALDSLARMIASTESFFHPTNSGSWTTDLSSFIRYIVLEFNKRWFEEKKTTCKTPKNRRLTALMRRQLVKSLRTVVLLAMFSQEPQTVANIQSCLKSMCSMEPDLILQPILERAVPSLETLVETQRTTAVIKALIAVAPAIVCRDVYYPGAKNLVPLLQLLTPGIDLNDPSKTLCTTGFFTEIARYIQFGDLTAFDETKPSLTQLDVSSKLATSSLPSFSLNDLEGISDVEARLSDEQEDAILKDSTRDFPDWIANFIRRVIQLLENLPDDDNSGQAEETTEEEVVDSVMTACKAICNHLSEHLYDMVLGMVFDYASTTVRPNAVRAIHQLVECVASANPAKTLAKFVPFCSRNIRAELENGASSLRTTSSTVPLPSDATLHWNVSILRGAVVNDGVVVLKYQDEFISLIQLLHDKTFTKRGYSWTGKLLSSLLYSLTHTFPNDDRFVNPAEWESEEFTRNHHLHWGKLLSPSEVKISWHVPNDAEIGFALRIFKELIEPTLTSLELLLKPGVERDAIWRNDFCRHLTLVRNAFAGIPTLIRMTLTAQEVREAADTSDIIGDIPEMIANVPPLSSGFALTDPNDPRYEYIYGVRQRFGNFLHDASEALRRQGDENSVDPVQSLVRSIKIYLLEYADQLKNDYHSQRDELANDKTLTQRYAGQKVWPRDIYISKARVYNSARLGWNATERKRGPLEDKLIDDLVEWSLWHYPVVRRSSQSQLESLCDVYDGIRRRALPVLFDALKPGTDDGRLKGALWTLALPSFGKYAMEGSSVCNDFLSRLFQCQSHELPSIQGYVSNVFEEYLHCFTAPNHNVDNMSLPAVDLALQQLKSLLQIGSKEDSIILRTREKYIERTVAKNSAAEVAVHDLLRIANSDEIHWRYAIYAIRLLRTLVRRDIPLKHEQLSYFLEKVHDDHPSIRYYAMRAVIKTFKYLKLRTLSDPIGIIMEKNKNPLKKRVKIHPSGDTTREFLNQFRIPIDSHPSHSKPLFCDKNSPGWLVWGEFVDLYAMPDATTSIFDNFDAGSADAVKVAREIVTSPKYWEDISVYYSEENDESSIVHDNVTCVKSIFQALEDEPFEALRPTVEQLILDQDQNKQRAAAEFLAGILGGSKHWPTSKQDKLWEWFESKIPIILRQNLKPDTLPIWTSFLEYLFYYRDPRRLQPLVDFILNELKQMDCNAELSFDVVKVISPFRALVEGLGRKFTPWMDETVTNTWKLIYGEHEDVRFFVGEVLLHSQKIMWNPCPSIPISSSFVKECQTLDEGFDIMSIRGTYHKERVSVLVESFKKWRTGRSPGTRAFQSVYDRVGTTVCRWLFQSLHEVNAISTFDYLLPLMPELFRFTELKDNSELAVLSSTLLVRMCGVTPPVPLVDPILDSIFEAIQTSPSWRVRLKALPLVQVFYFRNMPLIGESKIVELLEVLCRCLDDEIVEVREMAATTLSGILRLSPRRSILTLKDRFIHLLEKSRIPPKQDPDYNNAVRQRHAAILGVCALVDSFPYTVEKWLPDLLTAVLAEHTYDPIPISTTIQRCASDFKKTHQDTWSEDSQCFDEDQLGALSTLLTGSSYYA